MLHVVVGLIIQRALFVCLVFFNVVGLSLSPACDFWVQFGSSQFVFFFAEVVQALQKYLCVNSFF